MRIAIVCPYDLGLHGGVQQQCLELAHHLEAAGDEAVVVGPGSGPGTTRVGGSVSLPANRSRVPLSLDPRSWSQLRAATGPAQVVHVHEPFIPLVGWAALRLAQPTVLTFHADPARWTRGLYRVAAGPLSRLVGERTVTAVSPVAASALPHRWGKPELIPNGIDVGSYRVDVERLSQRVAFLGRDDPRKGLDVLLGAWPRVRERFPEAELVVMGAERSDRAPGVTFRGRVDDEEKRRLLAGAAVFVAPNLGGESFGVIVAEAMAAGCSVVASDLPAFRHVLDGNGTLVPPADGRALGEAIMGRLGDPSETEKDGRLGRAAAGRFDWSRVVAGYRAAYESALGSG